MAVLGGLLSSPDRTKQRPALHPKGWILAMIPADQQRRTFVGDLLDHAESGRLHSQDSELINIEIAKAKELKRVCPS